MRPISIALVLVLTAGLAFAKHPKVASDLNTNDPNATVDVIV